MDQQLNCSRSQPSTASQPSLRAGLIIPAPKVLVRNYLTVFFGLREDGRPESEVTIATPGPSLVHSESRPNAFSKAPCVSASHGARCSQGIACNPVPERKTLTLTVRVAGSISVIRNKPRWFRIRTILSTSGTKARKITILKVYAGRIHAGSLLRSGCMVAKTVSDSVLGPKQSSVRMGDTSGPHEKARIANPKYSQLLGLK
jgi:hypothetical protein